MNTIISNRATNGIALTDSQLATLAPSIFSTTAHPERSSRYHVYPTSAVVDGMREAGFQPVMAATVHRMRNMEDERMPFAKHIIRFQQAQHLGTGMPETPEVVLINAHDGTSAYKIMAGIFRFVCSNGLVVASTSVGSIRIPHRSNPLDVVAASLEMAQHSPMLMNKVQDMRALELTESKRVELATEAAKIRFGDDWQDKLFKPEDLLTLRRYQDNGTDLWSTFNILQENCTKGNRNIRLRPYYIQNERGFMVEKTRRFRSVQSINGNVKLNQQLWQLADDFYDANKVVEV